MTKCVGHVKQSIRDRAFQLLLQYVELERHEIVQQELMGALEGKQPKLIQACLQLLSEILRLFGQTVLAIKPIIKEIQRLIEDRDKGVRDEMRVRTTIDST